MRQFVDYADGRLKAALALLCEHVQEIWKPR